MGLSSGDIIAVAIGIPSTLAAVFVAALNWYTYKATTQRSNKLRRTFSWITWAGWRGNEEEQAQKRANNAAPRPQHKPLVQHNKPVSKNNGWWSGSFGGLFSSKKKKRQSWLPEWAGA